MFSESFFNKIIVYSFYLLFFLTPLILTPWNYELFEFNKMIFVYGITIIVSGAWLGKILASGEIKLKKTPLDLAFLFYLGSSILSTIYSIEPHTSLWGYYSRFNGGLVSTISYLILFYAFINNLSKKTIIKIIYLILLSSFLVSSYGILEHFGIDAKYWVQDVKNRVFSTLGQPNWLGAFIDAIIFIPITLALRINSKSQPSNNNQFPIFPVIFYILYTIFFFCLVFTSSKSAMLAFWLGLIIFSILFFYKQSSSPKKQPSSRKQLAFIWLATLIVYLLIGKGTYHYLKKLPSWLNIFQNDRQTQNRLINQQIKTSRQNKPFISESSDIRKVVWKGAIEVWKHYPLLGSGLETFAYSYYNFQPPEHNLLSEWDYLYNKAHNEFLNVLACQGIVGIISYLFVIGITIISIFKQIKNSNENWLAIPIFIGYLTILITNFFGFSVVMTSLFFFLFPAFLLNGKLRVFTLKFPPVIFGVNTRSLQIIVIGLILFGEFGVVKLWRADYLFNQGRGYSQSNQINYLSSSINKLQQAIKLNPNEALYHNQLSLSAAKLAVGYQQINSELKDKAETKEIINQLKNLALQETNKTLQLNPVHLNFYRTSARVFIYLSLIDPSFQQKALETIIKASKLAPTDAKIFYNLGLIYQQMGQPDKAKQAWQKALSLKPNYDKIQRLLK